MHLETSQHVYMGFDFGLRHIGVAIGQTVTRTASPLPIIFAKYGVPNWREIKALIDVWKPTALIVGKPMQMDDSDFELITSKAREFADELHNRFNLPVYVIDEKLTTKAAREYIYDTFGYKALQNRPIDSFAAKFILESWMNQESEKLKDNRTC